MTVVLREPTIVPRGWMHAHLHEPPLDGESFGVHPAVSSLIRWMLAKRRESRIGSMAEVAVELRTLRELLADAPPYPPLAIVPSLQTTTAVTPVAACAALTPAANGQAIAGLCIAVLG